MTERFSSILTTCFWVGLLGSTSCILTSDSKELLPARPISWEVVKEVPRVIERTLPGVVRAQRRVPLAFEVAGRIRKVAVDDGDTFQTGDVLVALETKTFDLAVGEAKARLREALARKKEAEDALARTQKLLERGAETQATLDQALSRHEQALGRVDQARAALNTMLEQKKDSVLLAPFNGSVASRRVEPLETVAIGTPVLVVQSEEGGFELLTSVPENLVDSIEIGSKHQVRLLARRTSILVEGIVTQVASEPDVRQAYPVSLQLLIPDPQLPKSGITAEVILTLPAENYSEQKSTWVRIPAQAFIAGENDTHYVYVFNPSQERVERRKVEIAELGSNMAYIQSGLTAGEIIANRGLSFLSDGQHVTRLGIGPERFEQEVHP